MRKADVNVQDEACAVIAHARWVRKRGRRPSMSYKGIVNPALALKQALSDIGATMAELHTVPLAIAPLPLALHDPTMRAKRRQLQRYMEELYDLARWDVRQTLRRRCNDKLVYELIDYFRNLVNVQIHRSKILSQKAEADRLLRVMRQREVARSGNYPQWVRWAHTAHFKPRTGHGFGHAY